MKANQVIQQFLASTAPQSSVGRTAAHPLPQGMQGATLSNHKNNQLDPCTNLKNGTPLYGSDGKVRAVCRNHHAVQTTRWPSGPSVGYIPKYDSNFGHPAVRAMVGLAALRNHRF